MNKEEKIEISVNQEDVQNIIDCYEKDIKYITKLENNWNELKEWAKNGMKNSLHIPYECDLDFEDVLDKMQEIESRK